MITFPFADEDVRIIDTETTGLGPKDEIVQITIQELSDANSQYDKFVKPTIPIPPEASAIHNYTDATVAGMPSFPTLFWEVYDLLQGKIIIGYNVFYDLRMIQQTIAAFPQLYKNGQPRSITPCAVIDLMGIVQIMTKAERWIKLSEAIDKFGGVLSESGRAHDSSFDVAATELLLRKLMETHA